jgi:crotonobetainyl-CoA:carnitine CoA-transferase CaiB-like acyl-CoA transferase
MVTGPLEGIRVVDLTIWMSGAIGSMLLGDLGAEVIKIEGPTGDPVRRYVPIGATESAKAPGGINYAYALCNRNKRQIKLDLRDPADRDRLYDLVRDADVFITSMQADTLASLGADEESIKSVNPAIVYAKAGGLGHAGPRANDRCQDMLGMAYAGLVFTASPEQDEPFAPPGATNDVLTGTMTAFGVLAALMQRQQSGLGGTVYTSLLHTALWTQLIQLGTAANAPALLLPARSRREPRSPGVNQYKCSDGRWIAVAAVTADAWARLVKALDLTFTEHGEEDLLSYAGVLSHAARVREILDATFAEQPVSYWLDRLEAAGIWCTPVNALTEVIDDEQVKANGYVSTLDDGLRTVAMPFTLAGYQAPARAARRLGEDNDAVLGDHSGSVQEKLSGR